MKIHLLSYIFLFASVRQSCAQADSSSLFREAENKLENNTATISQVLSDRKYLPLHPSTPFRELVKKHAAAGVLTIVTPDEPGKKIKVLCSVKDANGAPVAGALVYLYQTDYRGWYSADRPHVGGNEGDMRHARLFGYVKTDKNGQFELHTSKPSGYPQSDLPAHIHIHFWADGFQPYVTEFLFDDDDRLVGKIRQQAMQSQFIIAKPEKTSAPFEQQFSYAITMPRN